MSADWQALAAMRRRGERPVGGVWIARDARRRQLLANRGFFAVGIPEPEQCYLVAGLDVFLLAPRAPKTIDIAQAIASANARYFATMWDGDRMRKVIA
jgi:hypothetical protein